MKPADPRILTINGGSSSIKFALFANINRPPARPATRSGEFWRARWNGLDCRSPPCG
jgi:hypothetical protein